MSDKDHFEILPQIDPYVEAENLCKVFEEKFGKNCPVSKVINMFREERTKLIQQLSNEPSKLLDEIPQLRTIVQREVIKWGLPEIVHCKVRKLLGL